MKGQGGHTVGPWGVVGPTEHGQYWVRTKDDLTITLIGRPEAKANARLIAAAPDLLSACRAALDGFKITGACCVTTAHAVQVLSAAIAKAEGR